MDMGVRWAVKTRFLSPETAPVERTSRFDCYDRGSLDVRIGSTVMGRAEDLYLFLHNNDCLPAARLFPLRSTVTLRPP